MITRNRVSSGRTQTDSENPYWVSFSDLMAGLLVIFILALVFLMYQQRVVTEQSNQAKIEANTQKEEAERAKEKAEKAKEEAEEAKKRADVAEKLAEEKEDERDIERAKSERLRKEIVAGVVKLSEIEKIRIEILSEVSERLREAGIRIEISDNATVLRIPEETLAFETAKWEIPSASKPSVELIGQAIHDAITKKRRLDFIDTIFVEGHTDSAPFLSGAMGNWGLSTYRAIAVWEFWEDSRSHANQLVGLLNYKKRPVFSVSGYGSTRRIVEEDDTVEERRMNRRIDVRFTMKSVEQTDLEQLIERFPR